MYNVYVTDTTMKNNIWDIMALTHFYQRQWPWDNDPESATQLFQHSLYSQIHILSCDWPQQPYMYLDKRYVA